MSEVTVDTTADKIADAEAGIASRVNEIPNALEVCVGFDVGKNLRLYTECWWSEMHHWNETVWCWIWSRRISEAGAEFEVGDCKICKAGVGVAQFLMLVLESLWMSPKFFGNVGIRENQIRRF